MAIVLQQGSLVWVTVNDPAGRNPKCRPAVIVTPTAEIQPNGEVVVVAATSTFSRPLPVNHVELPWEHRGHPRTGLTKPCVAVCDWLVVVPVSTIQKVGGIVPTAHLLRILTQLPKPKMTDTDETSNAGQSPQSPNP